MYLPPFHSQKSRTQDTAGGIIRQRRCRTQDNEGRSRQSRLSAFNADGMDGVKGGVSYPPNLADAKEETPNGQTAYHAGQWTKEETRGRADVQIEFGRNGRRKSSAPGCNHILT